MTSAVVSSPALPPVSDDALIAAAQYHPVGFARLTKRDYRPAEFHFAIGDALRDVAAGTCDRLMIFVPPRHGKSELVSVRFPAWYLGRNSDKRVIATSYGADLAADFGRQARNVVESPEYGAIFPGVRLARDSKASDNWNIAGRFGGYVAAGVGGPITGRGAHVLLIDDPVKNREEAESATYRQAVWDWYTSTAYTRLEDGGAVVLIQTRWHEDDLAGRLLAAQSTGGDRWRVVSLPAISDADEPLWPEKYDHVALDRIRAVVGSRDWQALYQQRPTPLEGGLFKSHWWQLYDEAPAGLKDVALYVDSSFKTGVGNDPSCISVWAHDGAGNYYVLDRWLFRAEFPELLAQIRACWTWWSEVFGKGIPVIIEDKASGQSALQTLRRAGFDLRGEPVPALPVIAWKLAGGQSAATQAEGVTALVEAGRVHLPRRAPWREDFIAEHAVFPNGAHDDQVTTTGMALTRMTRGWQPNPDAPDVLLVSGPRLDYGRRGW